jgi:hypothetical protein
MVEVHFRILTKTSSQSLAFLKAVVKAGWLIDLEYWQGAVAVIPRWINIRYF